MNMIYHTFDWFYRKYVYMKNENSRIGKVFPENKLDLELLEYSDLVLINREFAFDDVLALPPNIIPISSLQVERQNEIPNDDVFTFIESSDKPIVLFTLGGDILAEDLGRERMLEIMSAFRELKEFKFICKCKAKFIRYYPQNVLFVDWFQQNELLGNSKVKLVITNAGLLTIQEAMWHQKPILGIPLQISQHKNIQRALDLGFAESLDVNNFTSIEIVVKVRMLVENPFYMRNIEKVSRRMKGSLLGPKATALHWIEEVLKHNGLSHLKSEARHLNFFKLYMVDFTFYITIIVLIYILIMQYHFIKEWVQNRERKKRILEDTVMNETDKLKSE
ncbi:CLUMA_CG002370, isoform A [Clunio marinus]|uniref:UDP-glucuronosyltransferase n=1 Tax=Clunio marinus TaxID=568069 RepID=A0A1J1HKY6_9DIPT|nr:CLUMA_CG002370, isoform A [Clunio marinus]